MKRMLLAIMAVAVAISFSAPSFADDSKEKKGKEEKKGGHVLVYGDEKKGEKKDEKKGGHMDTFGDKKDEKKDEKKGK